MTLKNVLFAGALMLALSATTAAFANEEHDHAATDAATHVMADETADMIDEAAVTTEEVVEETTETTEEVVEETVEEEHAH